MLRPEHLQNLIERTRKEFARKYCLHPKAPHECSKNIISAHSVQKALLKKFISINGHVGQIRIKPKREGFGLDVKSELIGIHDATTFSGFCGKHDVELFCPLETSGFKFTKHQIALLGYRAVCRELFGKAAEIASAESMYSYSSLLPDIKNFSGMREYFSITQLARQNSKHNLNIAKNCYTLMLSDTSDLRYYVVEFSDPPVYLSSVAFLPEWDFEGGKLQDLGSVGDFKPMCFSAWATDCRAVAVFCWHTSADSHCIPFIESLRKIDSGQLANRILSMAFEVSDNVVFRSEWWANLSEKSQRLILARAPSGVGSFERKQFCLADDGGRSIFSAVQNELVGYEI